MTRLARVALAAFTLAIPVAAQNAGTPATKPRAPVPFGVGERAEYNLKYGFIHAGVAVTEVLPLDSIRGHEVWHTVFRLRGGIPGFRINDRFESWM
ncbi:MAG TPA: DUF3108 domain-containing protein, partial [Gemmatimonadaceae bacterium]